MKLRVLAVGLFCAGGVANAGGLLLPGAGAVSTSRAGASTVAADDGEAISLNPAGIAKAHPGTVITIGIAAIDYFMSFKRAGNYPNIAEESTTYAGMPYPTMTNDAKPPLGIGSWQPVPLIAVVSDLGGAIPNLKVGVGLYAPNAYPFRDFQTVNGKPWVFNSNIEDPPPPTRYDVLHEEAALILPSVAVSYRVTPDLDLGIRGSAGTASVKSTIAVWGLQNHEEWQQQDGLFSLDASGTIFTGALGFNYRPTPNIEVGGRYTLPINVHASGTASSENGPAVNIGGAAVVVSPVPDDAARCAKGGKDAQHLKGCVDFELPQTVNVGGRYKLLDQAGKEKGDVELDLGWENWGATCDYIKDPTCLNPSNFRVVVDAQVGTQAQPNGLALKDNFVSHGLQDGYNVRIGGSWNIPTSDPDTLFVARGGISYDTAAAKPGWERLDLDGAARTMIAFGGSYKMKKVSIDAGFGFIYEGSRTQNRNCVVTGNAGSMGCGPGGTQETVEGFGSSGPYRQGPDPINPIVNPDVQAEHPVNEGTFDSHYLLIMLGISTWF